MMNFIIIFYIMLVVFQVKHFLCDFVLQNKYMLQKSNEKGWFLPLLTHAISHAIGTAIIVALFSYFVGTTWQFAFMVIAIDLITHFIVDRFKVLASRGYTPADAEFWNWLGWDQLLHHLTHYLIIVLLFIL